MAPLSLTGRRWLVHEDGAGRDVIRRLLERRGIEPLGEGELLEHFGHDARHFRDFAATAERITRALASREQIGVFGDYDCDGITATAILTRFLRRRGANPMVRLPHRLREGYGLQHSTVEEFQSAGVRLLLTVDTGVTAIEQITHAQADGIDVIVLDHHALPASLPPARAILHPALTSTTLTASPCGAGIAWSLVDALERAGGHGQWEDRETDIALAAIGTIADVVELCGGNRTLTHSGLTALQALRSGPLALLCSHAGLRRPYTSRDIAFRIAPRINAAGRMSDPHIALQALLGDSLALLQLETLNRDRQDVVGCLIEELLPLAEADANAALCFMSPAYSPGICGLLASKICDAFGKPTFVGSQSEAGVCTASLRSVPTYDITAALARCGELMLSFGGHAMAAGCTLRSEHFPLLRDHLATDVLQHMPASALVPTLTADCTLSTHQLTAELCDSLRTLEPFGQGNPEPRFLIKNARLERRRRVGQEVKHLQASVEGRRLIGFGLGHVCQYADRPLDLLCRVGIDTWQGSRTPQLFLDDMRVSVFTPEPVSLPS